MNKKLFLKPKNFIKHLEGFLLKRNELKWRYTESAAAPRGRVATGVWSRDASDYSAVGRALGALPLDAAAFRERCRGSDAVLGTLPRFQCNVSFKIYKSIY